MLCAHLLFFFFLSIRRPPRSTRTDTLFPYTTLFRSLRQLIAHERPVSALNACYSQFENIPAALVMEMLKGILKGQEINDGVMPHSYRSEEHTSELQSLMRISYAVFCLKKKKYSTFTIQHNNTTQHT